MSVLLALALARGWFLVLLRPEHRWHRKDLHRLLASLLVLLVVTPLLLRLVAKGSEAVELRPVTQVYTRVREVCASLLAMVLTVALSPAVLRLQQLLP